MWIKISLEDCQTLFSSALLSLGLQILAALSCYLSYVKLTVKLVLLYNVSAIFICLHWLERRITMIFMYSVEINAAQYSLFNFFEFININFIVLLMPLVNPINYFCTTLNTVIFKFISYFSIFELSFPYIFPIIIQIISLILTLLWCPVFMVDYAIWCIICLFYLFWCTFYYVCYVLILVVNAINIYVRYNNPYFEEFSEAVTFMRENLIFTPSWFQHTWIYDFLLKISQICINMFEYVNLFLDINITIVRGRCLYDLEVLSSMSGHRSTYSMTPVDLPNITGWTSSNTDAITIIGGGRDMYCVTPLDIDNSAVAQASIEAASVLYMPVQVCAQPSSSPRLDAVLSYFFTHLDASRRLFARSLNMLHGSHFMWQLCNAPYPYIGIRVSYVIEWTWPNARWKGVNHWGDGRGLVSAVGIDIYGSIIPHSTYNGVIYKDGPGPFNPVPYLTRHLYFKDDYKRLDPKIIQGAQPDGEFYHAYVLQWYSIT